MLRISNFVTVVDARMGRGKSSAAINYMNKHKDEEHFLYITPYLDEVGRICEKCEFDEPTGEKFRTKSAELKSLLARGCNVASTHSLYHLLDDVALELISKGNYTLIADECIDVAEARNISDDDKKFLMQMIEVDEESCQVHFKDENYTGVFSEFKNIASTGSLFMFDGFFLNIMNPDLLRSFNKVFMLTYMFGGQYGKAYLDFFGFEYKTIGIKMINGNYEFSDEPDVPPHIDYSKLITIAGNCQNKWNAGWSKTKLSANWYHSKGCDNKEVKKLRSNMFGFFRRDREAGDDGENLWTCYKKDKSKLFNTRIKGCEKGYLPCNTRATNAYKSANRLAYMCNLYPNPNVTKFFSSRGVSISADDFALSVMLQWIWRSAIRDDKPIEIYIPSERMRNLLIEWIKKESTRNYES